MGYQEDWDEIRNDPEWSSLPPKTQKDLARFYARKIVRPVAGSTSPQMKQFLEENVTGPAPKRSGAIPWVDVSPMDLPGETATTVGAIARNPLGFASEAIRGAADDGITGQIRRAPKNLVDMALDPLASAVGMPTSADLERMGVRRQDARMFEPTQNPGREHEAGSIFGQTALDPIGVAVPVNVFGKAAVPAAKTGINLLPKPAQAAPSALREALKGTVGASATGAGVAAGHSVLSDLNDGRPVSGENALEAAKWGGILGGPFGAAAHGLPVRAANQARQQAEQAALSRIAQEQEQGVLHPYTKPETVSDATLNNLDYLDGALRELARKEQENLNLKQAQEARTRTMVGNQTSMYEGVLDDAPAPRQAQAPDSLFPGSNTKDPVIPRAAAPATPKAVIRSTSGDIPVRHVEKVDDGYEYTTMDGRTGWVRDVSVRSIEPHRA
ncbi:MAG: hypothetical protein ACLGIN_09980, partial [Candidatus Sericytochromatia bacterium]